MPIIANSFCSIEYADEYFANNRISAVAWDNADEATKQKALNESTAMVKAFFDFEDCRDLSDIIDDSDGVNAENTLKCQDFIKQGCCEQAIYLLENLDSNVGEIPDIWKKGFSNASVGPMSVTLDRAYSATFFSERAKQILSQCGDYIGADGGLCVGSTVIGA
jgi:hypothetical protein